MELAKDSQGRTFLFGDYDAGRVVECNDPEMIIGTHAFELSMTITPTAKGYGILASHDRSCDGNFQFRLEIYQSMKVSLQCEGIKSVGGVTDGDPSGLRSELCSDALPLGQPSRVGIRRQSDGRFKLFVNDALVSEYRSGPPADLRIGTIRNGVGGGGEHGAGRAFRIGSRFPAGTGSEPYNTFAGTIRQAVLSITDFSGVCVCVCVCLRISLSLARALSLTRSRALSLSRARTLSLSLSRSLSLSLHTHTHTYAHER